MSSVGSQRCAAAIARAAASPKVSRQRAASQGGVSSSSGSEAARIASRSRATPRSTALARPANGALADSARTAQTARSTAAWSGASRKRICAAPATSVHSSMPLRFGMPLSSLCASALRIVPSRRRATVAIDRASAGSRGSRRGSRSDRSAARRSSSGRPWVTASMIARAAATRAVMPGGGGSGAGGRPVGYPRCRRANRASPRIIAARLRPILYANSAAGLRQAVAGREAGISDICMVLISLRPNSSKPNPSQTKPDQENGLGFSWIPSSDLWLFKELRAFQSNRGRFPGRLGLAQAGAGLTRFARSGILGPGIPSCAPM